jgi:two-component system response regulator CpxR
MKSLLIIDDDVGLCSMLKEYLVAHGLCISVQHDAASGLQAAVEGAFDLVILDLMLPIFDGFLLLRRLREKSHIGVIMLTARAGEMDRIDSFDAGADDYVIKPFSPRELLGRIQAILRRSALRGDRGVSSGPIYVRCGDLRLNLATREAFYIDHVLHLTETEFHLLSAFLDSPGTVISREALVARIFQREFHPFDRSLDMHVSRLRKKLDTIGCPADPIRTIRNSGYLFTDPALLS